MIVSIDIPEEDVKAILKRCNAYAKELGLNIPDSAHNGLVEAIVATMFENRYDQQGPALAEDMDFWIDDYREDFKYIIKKYSK